MSSSLKPQSQVFSSILLQLTQQLQKPSYVHLANEMKAGNSFKNVVISCFFSLSVLLKAFADKYHFIFILTQLCLVFPFQKTSLTNDLQFLGSVTANSVISKFNLLLLRIECRKIERKIIAIPKYEGNNSFRNLIYNDLLQRSIVYQF